MSSSFAKALIEAVGSTPYSGSKVDAIEARRRNVLGASLFFGRLVSRYPPQGPSSAVDFVDSLDKASSSPAELARALFYFFLDYPDQDGESISAHYGDEVGLSRSQRALVHSIWYLDNDEPVRALTGLGQPWEVEVPALVVPVNAWVLKALEPYPEWLLAYVDSKQPQLGDNWPATVNALATLGWPSRVSELSKTYPDAYAQLGKLVTRGDLSRESAFQIAQLGCTEQQWQEIQQELDPTVTKDPKSLAAKITMVRALHTGDTRAINALKQLTPEYDLLTRDIGDM